jgi:hypothetical protein
MSCRKQRIINFFALAFAHFGDFQGTEEDSWVGVDHGVGKGVEENFCAAEEIAEVEVWTGGEGAGEGGEG